MPKSLQVTTASETVLLDDKRTGKAYFNVTNVCERAVRVDLAAKAERPPTDLPWIRPEHPDRTLAPNSQEQIIVQIVVPPGYAPGEVLFHLVAVNEADPDLDWAASPTVRFAVIPEALPIPWFKRFWWVFLLGGAAFALGAVLASVLALVLAKPDLSADELIDRINRQGTTPIAADRLPPTLAADELIGRINQGTKQIDAERLSKNLSFGDHNHDSRYLRKDLPDGEMADDLIGRINHGAKPIDAKLLPPALSADELIGRINAGSAWIDADRLPVAALRDGLALQSHDHDSRYWRPGTAITLPANGLVAGQNQLVLANNRVGIGTAAPQATLDVQGDILANNIWVKTFEKDITSAADLPIHGLNGNADRRYMIVMQGLITTAGRSHVIGLRVNWESEFHGVTPDADYARGAQHWDGHEPGVTWHQSTGWVGGTAALLPLCVSHWNGANGSLSCIGQINAAAGASRMIDSESTFYPAGTNSIMSTRSMNAWKNTTTNITHMYLHFDGALSFNGYIAVYKLR